MNDPVLSHVQAAPILAARAAGETAVTSSLDLGRSQVTLSLGDEGVDLGNGRFLTWAQLAEIDDNENACYAVTAAGPEKIQRFSPAFNRVYTLMPTRSAPTMLISGLPMHRIKDTNPWQDTLSKIKTAAPLRGRALDTATGLGYTAIVASETAAQVTTIELDPAVLDLCRQNPWSQPLFTRPNITQIVGDAAEEIESLPDAHFSRIIHDPPTFSLAGHLYGERFYRQLYRVLTGRGRLFHYVGDPESRSGRGVTRGVMERLRAAGFRRVQRRPGAFGVVAYK
jgi:hypothetical protein